MLGKLASKGQPGVQYGKVDLQKNGALGAEYDVRSIPDTRIFHDGKEIGKFVGSMDGASVEELVSQYLASVRPVGEMNPAGPRVDQNGRALPPVDTIQPAIRPEPAIRSLPPGITPLPAS